jgi:hypothetical protein
MSNFDQFFAGAAGAPPGASFMLLTQNGVTWPHPAPGTPYNFIAGLIGGGAGSNGFGQLGTSTTNPTPGGPTSFGALGTALGGSVPNGNTGGAGGFGGGGCGSNGAGGAGLDFTGGGGGQNSQISDGSVVISIGGAAGTSAAGPYKAGYGTPWGGGFPNGGNNVEGGGGGDPTLLFPWCLGYGRGANGITGAAGAGSGRILFLTGTILTNQAVVIGPGGVGGTGNIVNGLPGRPGCIGLWIWPVRNGTPDI